MWICFVHDVCFTQMCVCSLALSLRDSKLLKIRDQEIKMPALASFSVVCRPMDGRVVDLILVKGTYLLPWM